MSVTEEREEVCAERRDDIVKSGFNIKCQSLLSEFFSVLIMFKVSVHQQQSMEYNRGKE